MSFRAKQEVPMQLRGTVSSAQVQGPRPQQEDFFVHIHFAGANGYGHLIGVLDGHNGLEVARYCAHQIPELFKTGEKNVEQELRRIVQTLHERTRLADEGSTLSLACINESKHTVTTAVLGDSPIIVIDSGNRIHVSDEHNVRTNAAELEAAIRRGATYKDGYIFDKANEGGLQMSRALGDRELQKVLDRTPTIASYPLGRNSAVLVASDGLFDPSHEDSEAEDMKQFLLEKVRSVSSAQTLVRCREQQELQDNTSAVLWRVKRWWEWFS